MSHKYPSKQTKPFDLFEFLTSEAHIEAYLETMLEENDPALLQQAMEHVAKARLRLSQE